MFIHGNSFTPNISYAALIYSAVHGVNKHICSAIVFIMGTKRVKTFVAPMYMLYVSVYTTRRCVRCNDSNDTSGDSTRGKVMPWNSVRVRWDSQLVDLVGMSLQRSICRQADDHNDNNNNNINNCICMCIYIYIHVYMYRERGRYVLCL